jgi:competence protein ComEC
LSAALAHRRVGRIWGSPLPAPIGGVALVRSLAGAANVPIETPPVGSAGRLGPMTWTVLGPVGVQPVPIDDAAGSESETENNASLVMMIEVSGIRILLTGDVEPPGQQAMLTAGDDLRADVLKVPHHGSAQQDPQFLAATHARFAIASAGLHNDYGHPAPRTVAALVALGMTVLRTDTEGSVAVAVRPDHTLVAVAQRDPAVTTGR